MVDIWPHLLVEEEGSKREEGASKPASSMLCFNRHRVRVKGRGSFEKDILIDQLIFLGKMCYLGHAEPPFDHQR